ncbi:hypothetical protein [Bizionia sp.]|uniref:hypothetical protein n=1 Tax=Bizionia sp. TaxID=1954480 RepID=UPI003A8E7DFA
MKANQTVKFTIFYFLFLVLIMYSCKKNRELIDTKICDYNGYVIPMPSYDELPKGDVHIENSKFLGWSSDGETIFYLKEKSGLGMADSYTVRLISQNMTNDGWSEIYEYVSSYDSPESDLFNDIDELIEKKKEDIFGRLKNAGIEPCISKFDYSSTITKDSLKWSVMVNKNNVDNVERFNTKVLVDKPDGLTKTIMHHDRNKNLPLGYIDVEYLGHFKSPNETKAVVLALTKTREIEGATLYSQVYIGCALNDVNQSANSNGELTKNGKKILKLSALRGLLLGRDWYEVEGILGKPDKQYSRSNNTSLVYFFTAIDDYDNSIKHITVFAVGNYVKDIWTCGPGGELSISVFEAINTPKTQN